MDLILDGRIDSDNTIKYLNVGSLDNLDSRLIFFEKLIEYSLETKIKLYNILENKFFINADFYEWKSDGILLDYIKKNNLEKYFEYIDIDETPKEWKSKTLPNYKSLPLFLHNIDNSFFLNKNINTHFLCYNNVKRLHRDVIVKFLHDSGIASNSIVTYHDTSYCSGWNDVDDSYNKTFCNIVTDTSFYLNDKNSWKHSIHLNEKISKPIQSSQPFLMVSAPYYLKTLKSYGFKTFDKWWDESYDDEVDDDIRMSKIQDNISMISEWSIDYCNYIYYNEMQSVLIHNKSILDMFDKKYRDYRVNSNITIHNVEQPISNWEYSYKRLP